MSSSEQFCNVARISHNTSLSCFDVPPLTYPGKCSVLSPRHNVLLHIVKVSSPLRDVFANTSPSACHVNILRKVGYRPSRLVVSEAVQSTERVSEVRQVALKDVRWHRSQLGLQRARSITTMSHCSSLWVDAEGCEAEGEYACKLVRFATEAIGRLVFQLFHVASRARAGWRRRRLAM